MSIIKDVLEILYPYRCPFCKDIIEFNEKICNNCYDKLPLINKGFDVKGNFPQNKYIDNVYSALFYKGDVTKAIINFKSYNNKGDDYKQNAIMFINILLKDYNYCYFSERYDIITYIPSLNSVKNHSFELAYAFSKEVNICCGNLVSKNIETKKQHLLNMADRYENIEGVFDVNNDIDINGKSILIIDDVITTGSTCNECARVLKSNGANKVSVMSLAIAESDGGKNGR
ncbi:MAG: ComF family protein [Oscillospiraceae bacterium]